MRINLSRVTNDARLQRRVKGLDSDHVQTMAQLLLDDPAFDLPPVSAVSEGNDFHFWDGWHRIEAYRQAKRKDIPATVTKGTWRDAWKASFNANGTHGMPRTKADIEAVLKAAFDDDDLGKMSDSELARMTGVSHQTIGRHRKKLTCPSGQVRTYTTKHGTPATMNTANIGRTSKAPVVEDVDEINAQLAASAQDDFDEPHGYVEPPPPLNGTPSTNGKHTGNGKPESNGHTATLPKVGSAVFDDRTVSDLIGKLIRTIDARANALGEINATWHKEMLDGMETVANAWNRAQAGREKRRRA